MNMMQTAIATPLEPDRAEHKPIPGVAWGSWGDDAGLLRIAFHLNNGPGIRSDLDGFRCVSGLN